MRIILTQEERNMLNITFANYQANAEQYAALEFLRAANLYNNVEDGTSILEVPEELVISVLQTLQVISPEVVETFTFLKRSAELFEKITGSLTGKVKKLGERFAHLNCTYTYVLKSDEKTIRVTRTGTIEGIDADPVNLYFLMRHFQNANVPSYLKGTKIEVELLTSKKLVESMIKGHGFTYLPVDESSVEVYQNGESLKRFIK